MEKLTQAERERLQSILGELNEYETTGEILRKQISLFAASISEISMTVEAIKTVKGLKPGTEILVPLGSDSFVTANLALTEKVITGLGAEVAAQRSATDAIVVLQDRREELEQELTKAQEELGQLGERIEALRPKAEQLLKRVKQEQP